MAIVPRTKMMTIISTTSFSLLLLLVVHLGKCQENVVVSYVTPNYGGNNGGTQVRIFGAGFDTNLKLDSSEPTKEVIFVSPYNQYDCLIHEAESDERLTVCYTGKMEYGTYYMRMRMNGVWLDRSNYCGGNWVHSSCRFQVHEEHTPYVTDLSWITGEPNSLLGVGGRIFTTLISSVEASSTNGKTAAIVRVWMTSGQCRLYNDTNEPYTISLGNSGQSDWGNFACLVNNTYIGNQNISFIVDQNYGRSLPVAAIRRISADNRIYMLQTYAVVTDVSPKTGSIYGATLITIKGRYFDDLSGIRAKVMVGGRECIVKHVTSDEIQCLTPPRAPLRPLYSGGRGINVEVHQGLGLENLPDDLGEGSYQDLKFLDHTHPTDIYSGPYVSRTRGFFVPSIDADYSLTIRADDLAQLYFNKDGPDSTQKKLVASSDNNGAASTERFSLIAGTEYYYEIRHLEKRSGGEFKLSVYANRTTYTPDQTGSVVAETQTLTTHHDVAKEVQLFTFNNWKERNGTYSQWKVSFHCNDGSNECLSSHSYRLAVFGHTTDYFNVMISSKAVIESSLQAFVEMAGEQVNVTMNATDRSYIYVTFLSSRGRIELSGESSDSSQLNVTLVEEELGTPDLSTITLLVNNIMSDPIPVDATEDQFASGVKSLFGPNCPRSLEHGIGEELAYYDFESNNYHSGSRTTQISYCGVYSLKNPSILFKTKEPFDPELYPDICFAYKGDIDNAIKLTYSYQELIGSEMRSFSHDLRRFDVDMLDSIDEWTHICHNIYDIIRNGNGDEPNYGFNIEVSEIAIAGGSTSSTSLFVDNVFVGKKLIPDQEIEGIAFTNSQKMIADGHVEYTFENTSSQIQVRRITSASSPILGTFDIRFNDDSYRALSGLSVGISADGLKNELETLHQIDAVKVTRSGSCYGYTWGITFLAPGGDFPTIVVKDDTVLSSPNKAEIKTSVRNGGMLLEKVYGDFLRTAHPIPQVQVYINNVPSHCAINLTSDTSCGFEWTTASTPVISDVLPQRGPVGTELTIEGSGFSSTEASNINVKVGEVDCSVINWSETEIHCTLGKSPSGNQPVVVNVRGKGLSSSTSFEVVGTLTSITPTSGSNQGCTEVTINGTGFDVTTEVSIGGSFCDVTSVTYTSVTCITSSGTIASGLEVAMTTSEVKTSSVDVTFSYTDVGIGTISEVSPLTLFPNGGTSLVISGSGFGTVAGQVYFNTILMENVTSWADDTIQLDYPPSSPGNYQVKVVVPGIGCAANSQTVTYTFSVSDIIPTEGSLVGGTSVQVTGTGLTEDVSVKFGNTSCIEVKIYNQGTTLTCVTSPARSEYLITNTGKHVEYGLGYAWNPSTLNMVVGDQVTFQWTTPFLVTNIKVGVFTTQNTSTSVYDENGFIHQSSTSGRLQYVANKPGKYYFASGCVDSQCNIFMRGVLDVEETTASLSKPLFVSVAGHQAENPDGLSFLFSDELTPTVSKISPRYGTTVTTIVIEGDGFDGNVTVTVGEKLCLVEDNNITHIICKVDRSEELPIGIAQEVRVHVNGKGYARTEIRSMVDRTFVLLPRIDSTAPPTGSLAGGTKLTIKGSGFNENAQVRIGSIICDLQADETSYQTIICITPSVQQPISAAIQVYIGGRSIERENSHNYKFDEESTPRVKSWMKTDDWADLTITFEGEGFGLTIDDVTIELVSGEITSTCKVTSMTDVQAVCNIKGFAVGLNIIKMHVKGRGYALFDGASPEILSPAVINSVSPLTGSTRGGTRIEILGNGFVSGDTTVTIDGNNCEIETVVLSKVTCITPSHSEGDVAITVTSNGISYSDVDDYQYDLSSTPQVQSISPNEGVGDDRVTLIGSGFGTSVNEVMVTFGGVSCEVDSVNEVEIQCVLGNKEGGVVNVTVDVLTKGLAIVDETFKYSLTVTSVSSLKEFEYGKGKMFHGSKWLSSDSSGTCRQNKKRPKCRSYAGGQLLTFQGKGFSKNTVIKICNNRCIVMDHFPTNITCLTPSNMNYPTDRNTSCDVTVANGESDGFLADKYVYEAELTPIISRTEPKAGGTAGGTRITIEGNGFKKDFPLSVSIDGSECDIISSSDTEILVETNEHQGSVRAKIRVSVGDMGIATQENADFRYVDRWSSVFTWGGIRLPTTEDFVIIPRGQSLVLDTDTPVLKMLLIDGGELIFDEKNVTLNAENILITNGGLLQIGTEEQPHQSDATIVMHGHLRSLELPIYGAKTLGVRNGTLDLHGIHIPHPWTKLSATANAGDTEIVLEKPATNWRVGDYVVIATTGGRHSQSQNEKRQITAISPDKFYLTIDPPLSYRHYGVTVDIHGTVVDFKAEVGLLSRNIVFRGSNDNQWNDKIERCKDGFDTGMFAVQTCFQGRFGEEIGSDQFGASIMIHSKEPNSPDIKARIEGVEVTYAGQAFRLGRYPIHWHLMGSVEGMYVKRCAIHQTFNRAITIHGTHKLLVEANVVYDVMGGAIFIEDGIETENIIQYNLVVFVKQSTSLLNDDITPAAYWVTNPNNMIRHNHAAGGTHFGFWYRMHSHPDGPSFTQNVCPQNVELGEFRNNTVHSQGWFGLWIFENYFPVEGSRCGSTTPSAAKFYSLTTWNCEKGAEWVNVGAVHFIDFVMVNNDKVGIAAMSVTTGYGDTTGTRIINPVLIGNHDDISPKATGHGLDLPGGRGMWVTGARFINLNLALKISSRSGDGGNYIFFDEFSFVNTRARVNWGWPQQAVIVDRDSTFSGADPMTLIAPYSRLFNTTLCPKAEGPELSSGLASLLCPPGTRLHRMTFSGTPGNFLERSLFVSNQHGNTSSPFLKIADGYANGWTTLLPSKEEYRISVQGKTFTNFSDSMAIYDMLPGDYLFINHSLAQRPDVISLNNHHPHAVENSTAISASSGHLAWHYDQDTQTFKYLIKVAKATRKRRDVQTLSYSPFTRRVSAVMYRCLYEDCIYPTNPYDAPPPPRTPPTVVWLWSNRDNPCMEWPDNDTVVIKRSSMGENGTTEFCWVVVDVAVINVDNITIEGTLQFSKRDINVSAIYIMVQGGRIVAGLSGLEYFPNRLIIELRGNTSTPEWNLPGISLGAKGLGCYGGCDFHGKSHDVYWTQLRDTAQAESKIIVLMHDVDWQVGDEIVITTTGYGSSETEKHVIADKGEDLRTITLRDPLQYRHMGKDYRVGDHEYAMRAEVGLLSRNIVIKGANYFDGETDMEADGFGARVIVGNNQAPDGANVEGWARFENVEFFKTGQIGSYSLQWWDTGPVTESKPSFVVGCAFHEGYATAIGVSRADLMVIENNIVHRTTDDGIRLAGFGHTLNHNLVTMALSTIIYQNKTSSSLIKEWHASFDVTQATQLTMIGNTAAGSHKVCFHTNGEYCDRVNDVPWKDNVGHGCVHGMHLFPGSSINKCTLIRNFLFYKVSQFGIYQQTSSSVIIRDTMIVDAKVAYLPLVAGPTALSHTYENKFSRMENCLCVGRSDDYDPKVDVKSGKEFLRLVYGDAVGSPSGGKVCITLPVFQSGPNKAPRGEFIDNREYPALHGMLNISNLHVHHYKQNSDNTRDVVFMTNIFNEDAFHPTYLHGTITTEVDDNSKAYYHRPLLGKINPADCVDMECDAKKKALVKDLDGGFLGSHGAIIPEAEFAWDDPAQKSRGLGDYRIPKAMLTGTDGTRFPVTDVADGRGIAKTNTCQYMAAWQAYNCNGNGTLDYQMLVIESLDGDTETRRLSPVALLGNRYIDLNNGPQDHGWCSHYTCQKRISTFHTVVAADMHFDIFFTGYAPRKLRLHFLNVDDTKTVRVAIWYPRPERLDVIRRESRIYIHPENSYYDSVGDFWGVQAPTPENNDLFKPAIDSSIHGANYMDRTTRLLYVTMRGSEPLDIVTVPAIILGFGVPPVSVDEFFEKNLINNLALFLNVPSYKIVVANVVREKPTGRKRRSTNSEDTVIYSLMFSEEMRNTSAVNLTSGYTAEYLNELSETILLAYQTETLWELINITGISYSSSEAVTNVTTETDFGYLVEHKIPTSLAVSSLAAFSEEFIAFPVQPVVRMYDELDEHVATLGGTWKVTASLAAPEPNVELRGDTTVEFFEGVANFTNLRITKAGIHALRFQINEPSGVILTSIDPTINITERSVFVDFVNVSANIEGTNTVNLTLELRNSMGGTLEDIDARGHTWKVDVALDDSDVYLPATLGEMTTFTFDTVTSQAITYGLKIENATSYHKYNFVCRVYSDPAQYEFTLEANAIQYASSDDVIHQSTSTVNKRISIELLGQPYTTRTSTSKKTFDVVVYNKLAGIVNEFAYLRNNLVTPTNGNTMVTFIMTSLNEADSTSAADIIYEFLSNDTNDWSFAGTRLSAASSSCVMEVDESCYSGSTSTLQTTEDIRYELPLWVFLLIAILASVLLCIILVVMVLKRGARVNKVGAVGGCLDANSSRGSSPGMNTLHPNLAPIYN